MVNIRVDVTVVSEMVEAGVGAGGSVGARVETGEEAKNGEVVGTVVVAAVVSAPETVVMETIGIVSEKEGG